MVQRVDVIVIGGGVMGSAAAWQLARRGYDTIAFDRFGPAHPKSASAGGIRNFNPGYPDETYLALLERALPLWRLLEEESRRSLLNFTGMVLHGPHLPLSFLAERLPQFGFEAELLDRTEARRRFDGMHFDGNAVYARQAGTIDADQAVAAIGAAARAHGAIIQHHANVRRIRILGDDRTQVEVVTEDAAGNLLDDPRIIESRRLVVTAGAWTTKLLGRVIQLPRLHVIQQQPLVFDLFTDAPLPGFNFHPQLSDRPGFLRPGFYGAVVPGVGAKIGWHALGKDRDPDAPYPKRQDRQLRAFIQRYVRDWLPGINPDSDAITPEYPTMSTGTSEGHFIMDRIGPIVVGAGFSGHGFKFAPAIGSILADLVEGGSAQNMFSLDPTRRQSALRNRFDPLDAGLV